MATPDERIKVLQMIQDGKITAEQGMSLLKAMDGSSSPATGRDAAGNAQGARWLRVRVTDTVTSRVRVNIRMPISVVNAGMKMGAKFSPEVQGLDMDKLAELIRSGEMGQVVDVTDEKDGEHVEVYLE
jgi:hypothetical protein